MTYDRQTPKVKVRICWAIVVFVALLSAVGIAVVAPRMAPVRHGDAHAFWYSAVGVSLSPEAELGWGGNACFTDDGWAVYEETNFHGSDLYRVSATKVLADFGLVVAALEEGAQRGEDTPFIIGYVSWRDEGRQFRTGPGLVESIRRARHQSISQRDVHALASAVSAEQLFYERLRRADWYWANMVFEWSLFTGLTFFILWPVIRSRSALRWALHVAFVPLLFMLPTYLGYATFSFTSVGPSGGILYPFVLRFCGGWSFTAADVWMLRHLPEILEPISVPIGMPAALSGRGMPGPTYVMLAGLIAGAVLLAMVFCYRQWARRRL